MGSKASSSPPVTIRPPLPSEFETLARIFHQAVWQVARQHYSEDQARAWSAAERPPEHWQQRTAHLEVRLATLPSAVAGFIGFSREGHIDLLFTHPAFVRRGVARALLTHAEQQLRKAGVHVAWTEASLTARPFFESMGYTVVREQTVSCGGVPLTNFLMEKRLRAGTVGTA